MKVRKTLCALVVLFLLYSSICAAPATGGTQGDESNSESGYSEPYQYIEVQVGKPAEVPFTINMDAFRFVRSGDGYHLRISSGGESICVDRIISPDAGRYSLPAWPTVADSTTLCTDALSVGVECRDDSGKFVLSILPLKTGTSLLKLEVELISVGFKQTVSQAYRVDAVPERSYEITFAGSVVDSDGRFNSTGVFKINGEPVADLSGYSFYAVGLFSGITINNDLTVTGMVDISDERWFDQVMPVTVVVSSDSSESYEIIDSSIRYHLKAEVTGLSFKISNRSTVMIDGDAIGGSITVFAGTELKITVGEGTCATLLYETHGLPAVTTLISPVDGEAEQLLITSGTGVYTIYLGHDAGHSLTKVRVNIIAPLVPSNNIVVSCGPYGWEP